MVEEGEQGVGHAEPQRIETPAVSTLLEILHKEFKFPWSRDVVDILFQPFLRFYLLLLSSAYRWRDYEFQPFLRFYLWTMLSDEELKTYWVFQPFLRFYRSCVRFLWVFKFFFGFL